MSVMLPNRQRSLSRLGRQYWRCIAQGIHESLTESNFHGLERIDRAWISTSEGSSYRNDGIDDWGSRWKRRSSRGKSPASDARYPSPERGERRRSPSSRGKGVAVEVMPEKPMVSRQGYTRYESGFPVSSELHKLMSRIEFQEESAIIEMMEKCVEGMKKNSQDNEASSLGESDERQQKGKNQGKANEASAKELMLLAEIIECYLATAPNVDPKTDGIGKEERDKLITLGMHLRETYGDGGLRDGMVPEIAELSHLKKRVVNTVPPGRLPWQIFEVDENNGAIHCAVDLTQGKAYDNWRNSHLRDEAKLQMWKLHCEDPEKWSVEELAKVYKIRQQRVMAILALKEMEAKENLLDDPEANARAKAYDEKYGNYAMTGSGERHYVNIPSFPNYLELDEKEVIRKVAEKTGKSVEQIVEEGLTPEAAFKILGLKTKEEIEEELAVKEEETLIKEFKAALDFNLGKTGTGISRQSLKKSAPRRPSEGWSFVVTPLGNNAKEKNEKPYVAQPDGNIRPLNESEALHIERKTPKPRRRIM